MVRKSCRVGLLLALALMLVPLSGTASAADVVGTVQANTNVGDTGSAGAKCDASGEVNLDPSAGCDAEAIVDKEVDLQKCVVVNDVGNTNITVKKNRNDQGTTVSLKAVDKVVICLNVHANVDANAQLHLDANLVPGEADCGLEGGAGANLAVNADVVVRPGYTAVFDTTVHAFAGVNGPAEELTKGTLDQEATVGNNPDTDLGPEVHYGLTYCKTIEVQDDTQRDA